MGCGLPFEAIKITTASDYKPSLSQQLMVNPAARQRTAKMGAFLYNRWQ